MSGFGGLYPGAVGFARKGRRGGGGASMAGVTKDATSAIYRPATNSEWTTTLSVAGITSGNPLFGWTCQDASGAIADFLGAHSGTVTGTITYRSPSTGWSSVGLRTTSGVAGVITNSGILSIGTTSTLVIAYVDIPTGTVAAERTLLQLGTPFSSRAALELSTTPALKCFSSSTNSTTGTNPQGSVRPLVLQVNHTAGTVAGYSNTDALAPTAATMAGGQIKLGGDNNDTDFPAGQSFLYAVVFQGTSAELTKAQIKKLLQTLGWTISWT